MDASDQILDRILSAECVRTEFQPIISLKKKSSIALEALSRGQHPESGRTISPIDLFRMAGSRQTRVKLDRLCRKKALENFAPLHQADRDVILNLNIDASIIDKTIVGSGHLYGIVQQHGVPSHNVVIEIVESHVADLSALVDFVGSYREFGFLIALDDVGAGHSNLDRIPLLKPDILKIDRGLISDIDDHYHKQEITRSLVKLSGKLGAMVVAEGVERLEEVIFLMELGVDLFQGYFFAEPSRGVVRSPELARTIEHVASRFKDHMLLTINAMSEQFRVYNIVIGNVVDILSHAKSGDFDLYLSGLVESHPDIECVYVLSSSGLQISNTICDPGKLRSERRFIYQPAAKGADHSLKDYYLPLRAGLASYTTEPYISMASGNLCQTISTSFKDIDGKERVLCMDVSVKK